MIILFSLLAVSLLAIASMTGPIYLLLRKTPYACYAVELSILLFPALVVLSGSLLGHVHARDLRLGWVLSTILAGCITTSLVIYQRRASLGSAARMNGRRLAILFGLALVAGLIVVPRQVVENKLGYMEFMNGEFLNYSQLAVFSMGHQHSDLPSAFLANHQSGRDGTDFLNVSLARLIQTAPVDIVQLTSAFLRMSYVVLCLLVIWELGQRAPGGRLVTAVLLLGFVFWNIDIYAFQVSFMASNAALGSFVLLILLLTLPQRLPPAPFLALYCLGNLYLLVTYPEIMPFLKICEAAYWLEQWLVRTDRAHISWTLPLANLLVFAINPPLVLHKISFVHEMLNANAGWNFLGSPIDDLPAYIQRLTGLGYNFVPGQPLLGRVPSLAVLVTAVALLGWSFSCVSRRLNTRIVWLVPLGLIWFHLAPLVAPPDTGPRVFYGAAKFILLWAWLVPLSLCIALTEVRYRVGRVAVAAALAALLAGNFLALRRAIAFEVSLPTFYSQQLRQDVIKALRARSTRVAIASEQIIPLWYWFQVLDYAGLQPMILSPAQANLIARAPSAPFLAPTLAPSSGETISLVQPQRLLWFSRLEIIEVEESTAAFNKMTQSNFTVSPGKLLVAAPQVELREAVLVPRPYVDQPPR